MLWSPNQIQGVGTDKNTVSIPGAAEGYWRKSCVAVGGFSAAGLNVNNNYDNDNNGVGCSRKSCYFPY